MGAAPKRRDPASDLFVAMGEKIAQIVVGALKDSKLAQGRDYCTQYDAPVPLKLYLAASRAKLFPSKARGNYVIARRADVIEAFENELKVSELKPSKKGDEIAPEENEKVNAFAGATGRKRITRRGGA